MKKNTWLYFAGAVAVIYLITLSYKKYKVSYEEAPEEDQKEVLIAQILILKNEQDTPANRAKYSSMTVQQLQDILTPKEPIETGPDQPTDTTGVSQNW